MIAMNDYSNNCKLPTFGISYEINNFSDSELVVRTPGGINYTIPPKPNADLCGKIVIAFSIVFPAPGCITFGDNPRSKIDEEIIKQISERERQLIQQEHKQGVTSSLFSSSFRFEVVVAEKRIESNLLGFELNIEPSRAVKRTTLNNSVTGIREALSRAESQEDGLSSYITVVDGKGELPILHANIFGKVFPVKPVTNSSLADGVYLSVDNNGETITTLAEIAKLDMKDLNSVGLYANRWAAEEQGNSKVIQELKSKVGTLSSENKKLSNALLQSNHKTIELERERFTLQRRLKEDAKSNRIKNNSTILGDVIKVCGFFFTAFGLKLKFSK